MLENWETSCCSRTGSLPLPAPVEEDLSVSTGDDPAMGRAQRSDDTLSAVGERTVRVGQGGVWPWHHDGGDKPGVTPEVGRLSTSLSVRVTLHHPLPNPGNPSTEGGVLQGMVGQTLKQIVYLVAKLGLLSDIISVWLVFKSSKPEHHDHLEILGNSRPERRRPTQLHFLSSAFSPDSAREPRPGLIPDSGTRRDTWSGVTIVGGEARDTDLACQVHVDRHARGKEEPQFLIGLDRVAQQHGAVDEALARKQDSDLTLAILLKKGVDSKPAVLAA